MMDGANALVNWYAMLMLVLTGAEYIVSIYSTLLRKTTG
jgi:hypothetical protein